MSKCRHSNPYGEVSNETVQTKTAKTAALMEIITEFAIILLADEVFDELGWLVPERVAEVLVLVPPVLVEGGLGVVEVLEVVVVERRGVVAEEPGTAVLELLTQPELPVPTVKGAVCEVTPVESLNVSPSLVPSG